MLRMTVSSQLPELAHMALFLDFDGTLVPFADKPENVVVPARLPQALVQIGEHVDGALAIVTGRPIDQVDGFLNASVPFVAGEHGASLRMGDGPVERMNLPNMSDELRSATVAVADFDGVWIEEKSAGFAVHYRQAPSRRSDVQASLAPLSAARQDLHLLDGNHVFELRAAAANKGVALRRFMDVAPFAGRVPVFIGDDTTDEDAFAAAQAYGGVGIKVGEGATCAHQRLPHCAAVNALLDGLANQVRD